MRDDAKAHLHDVVAAGQEVKGFVENCTFEDYKANSMLRSAVERKFEIMGEALTRIRNIDPELLTKIRDSRDIISFRNILIHGYDTIDDRIVWDVIQEDLENLIVDAGTLLAR